MSKSVTSYSPQYLYYPQDMGEVVNYFPEPGKVEQYRRVGQTTERVFVTDHDSQGNAYATPAWVYEKVE